MSIVGKVNDISTEHYIEWKISNFSSLSGESNVGYYSPNFSFANESWCLAIFPNGHSTRNSSGYLSLYLIKKSAGSSSINIELTLGLKTVTGMNYAESHHAYIFKKAEDGFGTARYLLRSKLLEEKLDFLQNDVLTVFCNLKNPKASEILSGSSVLSQKSRILQDFKQLFKNQEDCDVIIQVKEKEFHAHKAILKVRSPVFASTFRNNMKEKMTGIINIEDCDPSAFSEFLCFLYCGDVENLSQENAFNLYILGDKYDIPDLREKCMAFMKANLSINTFCETMFLALRHTEDELIKVATNFFIRNAQDIIETAKWQSFLADNPIQSNELFIKLLACNKS